MFQIRFTCIAYMRECVVLTMAKVENRDSEGIKG